MTPPAVSIHMLSLIALFVERLPATERFCLAEAPRSSRVTLSAFNTSLSLTGLSSSLEARWGEENVFHLKRVAAEER